MVLFVKSNLQKSRWFLYGVLLLIVCLYWCFDSVWSYISYEQNLSTLIFMVPSSFLDTFLLRVSPYQIASRLGVFLLLLSSGTLLFELGKRKQKVADALHESERRYRYLMDHANVGTCVLLDKIITTPNPKLLEITGYSEKEIENMSLIDMVHPDDRNMVSGWYGMTMAGENPLTDTPFQVLTREQGIKWMQLSTTLIVWQEKQALLSVLQDVTGRKIREDKQQQAKKMEAIGLLAGGVAHDLNNVLSGIVSYPELLLHLLPDDSPLCNDVKIMHEAGLRASAIVADLLTVARGVVSSRYVFDLNMLTEYFLKTPECRVVQERFPGVKVSLHKHRDQVPVLCSEIHIQKSIMNLLFNAFEAIERENGEVVLSTDWQDLTEKEAQVLNLEGGVYAVLAVADTGLGISDEQKEHIFEPFYTRKTMGSSGTGLGLTVVWNTALDHNGAIDIESSEKGTTFKLYLPLAQSSKILDQSSSKSDVFLECTDSEKRILLVDDEFQQRRIGKQFLEIMQYKVECVASGEEAVEFIRNKKVDLVVLDMIMDSGINGRETYEQIIAMHPGQRALIVSGYTEHAEIRHAMKLGVGGILKKPYTMKQLAEAVCRELNRV